MKTFLLLLFVQFIISEPCASGQPCTTKWTYQLPASSLTKSTVIFSSNPELMLILSSPATSASNPTVQVASIPYSYSLLGKTSSCDKSQVCCSNGTYQPSNETVAISSVGSTVMNMSLSFLDGKVSTNFSTISNSYLNSKYRIDMSPLQLANNFSNMYIIRRNTNVTQEMQDRPLLIPQSFYKTTYQCQFIGQMDTTICKTACTYFMTVQSLNDSGLYQLPNDVYYSNGSLITTAFQDFNVTVTIYDPAASPVVNPSNNTLIKMVGQTLLYLNNSYCLNLSLLNPTNISSLADLFVNTTSSNVYQKTLIFEQYQAINVSVCTTYNKYIVSLNGVDYSYEYEENNQVPKNATIVENVEGQCTGICHWWIWLIIGLSIASFFVITGCIIRAVCIARRQRNLQLEAKLQSVAGMTICTNPSIPTLTDLTLQHQNTAANLTLNRTFSNSLAGSRRVLQSPRIK